MNFDASVLNVAIEDIIPNRSQPRLVFDDASLIDLAKSIKDHGIIQPLVLRKFGDKYEIVAGERRYKAAQLAGLASVPAVVAKIDDKTSAEVAIAENVQRKPLTAIEEAKSYKALLDLGYMSQEQLAGKMGISVTSLNSKLRLLNLSPEVQDAIMQNKISERHGRSLLVIPEPEDQSVWLHRIIDERLTVRQLDEKLSEEFGGARNVNIDIDQIKQNATDIQPMTNFDTSQNISASNSMDLGGPIDLGTRQTGKFFNNLEKNPVSMAMTEAINPLTSGDNTPNLGFGAPQSMSTASIASVDVSTPVPVLGPPTVEEPTVLPSTPAYPSLFDMSSTVDSESNNMMSIENSTSDVPSLDGLGQVLSSPSEVQAAADDISKNTTLNFGMDLSSPVSEMNNIPSIPADQSASIDTLDTLDFSPASFVSIPSEPMGTNIPEAQVNTPEDANKKILDLVEELKLSGYNVQISNMDMPDQMIFNIVIKK